MAPTPADAVTNEETAQPRPARRRTRRKPAGSRWLNRLTNLLRGLGNTGREAHAGMQARGQSWLALAHAVEKVIPAAPATRRGAALVVAAPLAGQPLDQAFLWLAFPKR